MALRFQRLTRPAIRALQPGKKLAEHGITAERQKNGDVRFSVDIMADGQRIHRVIGRESEGITREQAERAIESFRTKAREGRLDLPTGRKVHRTFAEAGEDYLERIEHHPKHGRNLARKRQHIRQRLAPYFKNLRPNKLTDFAIAHYIRHRKAEGAAQATINRELSTLSHFLNRCHEWGWIKTKPKIDKGEEARKQIVILSESDKQPLMRAAFGDQDPLTWLFVAIAMGAGTRHSEILRLQWREIDFGSRRIYIGRAKAGQREQPMPPNLANRLQAEWDQLGEPTGYLFPTARADAKHPHRQDMAKQFKRTAERAKLDPAKVTPHILRHTAITELVKAGVDLPTIQKISGHKTLAMVLRYTQLSNEHVDRSVATLDSAFPRHDCTGITHGPERG
ncbi:tyrosine-type recombinase/integrase [Altericroceibacterium xinjiangense]|uniref:tyrosine-type recombinase/integrase n=1 Tax=Altericroceibacterium xinjiangense TaxID=762261 RepID=UPI000F7F7790|nr:site-specific integrase [Altericroceibacterium xinjiangense]